MLRERIALLLWEDSYDNPTRSHIEWALVPDFIKGIYLEKTDKILTAIREAAEEGMPLKLSITDPNGDTRMVASWVAEAQRQSDIKWLGEE